MTPSLRRRLYKDRYLFLLAMPGILYFIIYKYLPMAGIVIAFQEYSPFLGFLKSPWVGLDQFRALFAESELMKVMWNTLVLSVMQIAFAFPAPILLAILLNELRNELFKRFVQTIVYLPHFLSWVFVVGIFIIFLRGEGLINNVLEVYFHQTEPIGFLSNPHFFRPLIVLQVIWKEVGWGTILFLAALAGINPDLYEASTMDGANRWRKIWHVTLPGIRSTIIILLIIRLGHVMDSGFEQLFLMRNAYNKEIAEVLDTYVYYKGIDQSNYSFATAVGVFKGVIGCILVLGANRIAKKYGEQGIY